MPEFSIRPLTGADRAWVERFTTQHWGADLMVAHGERFYISRLPGFVAEADGAVAGLVTYAITNHQCEITSLDSLREGLGIGSALIEAVKAVALERDCGRLFLVTTNDNLAALRFYQRRGFVLAALRPGAVAESRKIKPEIPRIGDHGIPIRDELELEIRLTSGAD